MAAWRRWAGRIALGCLSPALACGPGATTGTDEATNPAPGASGGQAGTSQAPAGAAGQPVAGGGAGQGGAGAAGLAIEGLAAGGPHLCARLTGGRVKCWGHNDVGQLGLGDTESRGDEPGEMGDALPPVDLGARAVDLAIGGAHSCAVLEGGAVKCWGHNASGQLGLGDTTARGDKPGQMGDKLPAVDLGAGLEAVSVRAGSGHACAVLSAGAVRCWGRNDQGQLGLGDTNNRGDGPGEMGASLPPVDLGAGLRAVAVVPGETHTCALLEDGRVKCWGGNLDGELGLGDTEPRGDEPGEMGDALPFVDLGAGARATDLALGSYHTCALLDDGRVKCWGYNLFACLGNANVGRVGDEPGEMGDALAAVDLGPGAQARALSSAYLHVCARLEGGAVKCWGGNTFGQLGLGDTNMRGDSPGEMGASLPPVDLGTGARAVLLAAGLSKSCALLSDGRLRCWSDGLLGGIGLGDESIRGDEPGEMGDALPAVDLGASLAP